VLEIPAISVRTARPRASRRSHHPNGHGLPRRKNVTAQSPSSALCFLPGCGCGGGGGSRVLLGVVVVNVVVGGGGGDGVVVSTGRGGDDENGGSIMNSINARMNAATIAAIHSLRREVSGSNRAGV